MIAKGIRSINFKGFCSEGRGVRIPNWQRVTEWSSQAVELLNGVKDDMNNKLSKSDVGLIQGYPTENDWNKSKEIVLRRLKKILS